MPKWLRNEKVRMSILCVSPVFFHCFLAGCPFDKLLATATMGPWEMFELHLDDRRCGLSTMRLGH